jgi:hypothetical protein
LKSPTSRRQKQENKAMISPFSSIRRRKPIKITCDAPAYEIVMASRGVGMRWPEDVRWQRQAMPKGETVKREGLLRRIWRLLFAFGVPEVEKLCGCGCVLPERRFVLLHKRSGSQICYAVAQCRHCHTIAWDEEQMQRGVK